MGGCFLAFFWENAFARFLVRLWLLLIAIFNSGGWSMSPVREVTVGADQIDHEMPLATPRVNWTRIFSLHRAIFL
jgi:hypothetical protein